MKRLVMARIAALALALALPLHPLPAAAEDVHLEAFFAVYSDAFFKDVEFIRNRDDQFQLKTRKEPSRTIEVNIVKNSGFDYIPENDARAAAQWLAGLPPDYVSNVDEATRAQALKILASQVKAGDDNLAAKLLTTLSLSEYKQSDGNYVLFDGNGRKVGEFEQGSSIYETYENFEAAAEAAMSANAPEGRSPDNIRAILAANRDLVAALRTARKQAFELGPLPPEAQVVADLITALRAQGVTLKKDSIEKALAKTDPSLSLVKEGGTWMIKSGNDRVVGVLKKESLFSTNFNAEDLFFKLGEEQDRRFREALNAQLVEEGEAPMADPDEVLGEVEEPTGDPTTGDHSP